MELADLIKWIAKLQRKAAAFIKRRTGDKYYKTSREDDRWQT